MQVLMQTPLFVWVLGFAVSDQNPGGVVREHRQWGQITRAPFPHHLSSVSFYSPVCIIQDRSRAFVIGMNRQNLDQHLLSRSDGERFAPKAVIS